ncbi:MAG: HlyD family efflux transporter periplasmic adaptor subunit [Bacteroidetes bacterium]|nr:MAG: HlyD family efflux transporter periplasmic adaptor subunit [Bacteroidota bacterium]
MSSISQGGTYAPGEELNAILSRPPSTMRRWGISFLALFCGALLLMGWMVPWSERLEGEITLVSDVPPVVVTTPSEGYVQMLFVEEGDTVREGQLLALMETTARLEDVEALQRWADSLQHHPEPELLADAEVAVMLLQIGELQLAWDRFRTAGSELPAASGGGLSVASIDASISSARSKLERLERGLQALEREKKQLESAFRQAQKNYSDGLITLESLRKARSSVWDAEERIGERQAAIDAVRAEIRRLELEKRSVYADKRSAVEGTNQAIAEAAATLNARIEEWRQAHLITAPASGIVTRYGNGELKRRLPKGKEILAIVPLETGSKIVGQLTLSPVGAARLQEGQKVFVELYAWPSAEYGRLIGEVRTPSLLPEADGDYVVEVAFPNGLVTDKGTEIVFQPQLKGKAEVIVEVKPLIRKLIDL